MKGRMPLESTMDLVAEVEITGIDLREEPEEKDPPRLCPEDLDCPESFHQRLVDWLLQQR